MPTAQELHQAGLLEKIDVDLDPGEQPLRLMYALPRAITWMEKELPKLTTDGFVPGASSPQEQADTLFYEFIVGKSLASFPPKCLNPEANGVWELRTADLRFFGWFWRKCVYILSAVDTKAKCKTGLYVGYRGQAEHDRTVLNLDPPKFINGKLSDAL